MRTTRYAAPLLTVAILISTAAGVHAQGRGGGPPQPPRVAAPVDLTGYWVSLVTEDWRYRMATPPKGDFGSVPLNMEGQKLAQSWDPAKDEAAGNQCKAYGAAGLLRIPGRLHITWQDDSHLKGRSRCRDANSPVSTLALRKAKVAIGKASRRHRGTARAAR